MKTINNTVRNVNIFIIPNEIININDDFYKGSPTVKSLPERCMNVLGIKSESGRYVQIWTVSDDCDNWASSCDDCPINLDKNKSFRYPGYLPVELVENMKEGDIVEVVTPNEIQINMTASQMKYRYKNFGSFEEVLKRLM